MVNNIYSKIAYYERFYSSANFVSDGTEFNFGYEIEL